VKQLTDTEKRQLDTEIEEEQELSEKSPNTAEVSKETSGATGFTSSYLWKYGMLACILCLFAFNLFHFFEFRNFGYDQYGNLVIGLGLLFFHIAYYFTTKGWKSVSL
jgi:hypothetical protein